MRLGEQWEWESGVSAGLPCSRPANDKLTRESCRADELTWRATVREDWVRENSKTSSRPLLGGELDKEGSVSVHNRQSVSRERDAGDQMKERTPAKLP